MPEDLLEDLLYVKWFEPIAALLAAYELTRRGSLQHMAEVLGNLRRYFHEFPDVEALAMMAGLPSTKVQHPPLVLDGFLALNLPENDLPMPNSTLDFRGPWTLWQGD